MTHENPNPPGEELRRGLLWLAIATVFLFLVVCAGGALAYWDSANQRNAIRTNQVQTQRALCTFVADLQRRVDTARQFLREHPNGIPGISRAQLQLSIDNQQRTIKALDALECSLKEKGGST